MTPQRSAQAGVAPGIPAPRIVAFLLCVATAILVFRLPGAVIISGALPALAIVLAGLYRPRLDSAPLWAFLSASLASAFIAQFFVRSGDLPLVNYATLGLIFSLFAVAILCTGSERHASRAVIQTLYYAFGFTMLIGWGEVITGFRLQSILYPDSPQLQYQGRFYVAAYFPNFNDFGVVVAMFALMAIARFLFDARGPLVQCCRLAFAAAGLVLIVGGGSRGALGGLVIGMAVLIVVNLRLHHPRLVSGTKALVGILLATAAAMIIWSLPVIQDNSTQVRGQIVGDTIALSLNHPATVWFGWGNNEAFQAAAQAAYPGQLMDPHNLLLEIFTWYGVFGLLTFVALWLVVVVRGLWHQRLRPGWTNITAVLLFALTPILGIVPSSSLRYYYVFLLASCAMAAIPPRSSVS